MAGVFRPPYGAPTGPLLTDETLVDSFLRGDRTGHSPTFHIEEDALLAERFVAVAIRLDPGSVLVRTDIDTGVVGARLARAGRSVIEIEPPLATVVALQSLGLPAVPWTLHGVDADAAQSALRLAADTDRLS